MKSLRALAALGLFGCALSPRVAVKDEAYLKNKAGRVAVLDVYERSGAVEPATLQAHLARVLRRAGWDRAENAAARTARAPWDPAGAAQAARERGAAAALACAVTPAEGSPGPRRAEGDASVYSDVAGRRDYYRQDLYGERPAGPRVRAEVALVDAATAAVAYRAEVELPARDVSEEALADILLGPLEE